MMIRRSAFFPRSPGFLLRDIHRGDHAMMMFIDGECEKYGGHRSSLDEAPVALP